jgi:hypothetical protein
MKIRQLNIEKSVENRQTIAQRAVNPRSVIAKFETKWNCVEQEIMYSP